MHAPGLVAPDDLGEPQGKRPVRLDPDVEAVGGRGREVDLGQQHLAGGGEEVAPGQRLDRLAPAVERGQLVEAHVVDVHVRVELVGVVELEYVDLAEDALPQPLRAEVVEQVQRPLAEPRRREVGGHRLPPRAEVRGVAEMLGVGDAVGVAGRALRPGVGLVHDPALPPHQLQHLGRVGGAVDLAVAGVGHLERAPLGPVHEPVDGPGEDEGPVPPEVHVGLLAGNEQEVRIGLGAQRAEVGVELVEPQVGQVARIPVAVEVHDDRRVDPHRLQDRLERRRPVEPVLERLHRVGEVPVGAQGLVAVEGPEPVAVGEREDLVESRLGRAVGQEEEHRHPLRLPRRGVHPRIEAPVGVADLPNAERHPPSPRAVPQVPQVRREVAGEEVLVRRGKDRHAAAGGGRGEGAVAHLDRLALGVEAGRDVVAQVAGGVVPAHPGLHVAPGRPVGVGGHLPAAVVVVGDVGRVRGGHRLLLDQAAAGVDGVDDGPLEHPHAQPVEGQLDPLADGADGRLRQAEHPLRMPGAVGMAGREVEEGVPPTPPRAGLDLVERPHRRHHGRAVDRDRLDERPVGVERERRAPVPVGRVRPLHRQGVLGRGHLHGAGPQVANVQRHGLAKRGLAGQGRHEGETGDRCPSHHFLDTSGLHGNRSPGPGGSTCFDALQSSRTSVSIVVPTASAIRDSALVDPGFRPRSISER